MSDHDRTYNQFCAPRFTDLAKSIEHLGAEVHGRVDEMDKRVRDVEIVTKNGFKDRIKNVEKMQWWQLGTLVLIVGLIITLHVF